MVAQARFDTTPTWQDLPSRQQEIIIRLAQGLSNQEIADDLGIAVPTVQNNLADLYDILGFTNRVQAVLWVLAHDDVAAEVLESA